MVNNNANMMLYRGCPVRPLLQKTVRRVEMQTVQPSALQLLMQSNPSLDQATAAKFLAQVNSR